MTSQSVGLRNYAFQNGVLACIVVATRTVKACIRKATGTKRRLLLTIAVRTLLTIVAVKLIALFGAAPRVWVVVSRAQENGTQDERENISCSKHFLPLAVFSRVPIAAKKFLVPNSEGFAATSFSTAWGQATSSIEAKTSGSRLRLSWSAGGYWAVL